MKSHLKTISKTREMKTKSTTHSLPKAPYLFNIQKVTPFLTKLWSIQTKTLLTISTTWVTDLSLPYVQFGNSLCPIIDQLMLQDYTRLIPKMVSLFKNFVSRLTSTPQQLCLKHSPHLIWVHCPWTQILYWIWLQLLQATIVIVAIQICSWRCASSYFLMASCFGLPPFASLQAMY